MPTSAQRVEGGLQVKSGYTRRPDANNLMVSVITVCLNSEKHLERTVESVLSQSYLDIEYIIVDGGSTDGTLEIIRKYEDRITYWVSEPDEGIYHAMNKGISLATGDLVGIINSDDWYFPDAVDLRAHNHAMMDEMVRLSSHIAVLEREIEKKNALIEHPGE